MNNKNIRAGKQQRSMRKVTRKNDDAGDYEKKGKRGTENMTLGREH